MAYYFDSETSSCKSACESDDNKSNINRTPELDHSRSWSIFNSHDTNYGYKKQRNHFKTKEDCERQCLVLLRSESNKTSKQLFETSNLGAEVNGEAPDGSDVRLLLSMQGGSMAHFSLGPGKISRAVQHRTIDEIWFFTAGIGEMWRKQGNAEAIVVTKVGTCITIPVGTKFQFRSLGKTALEAVAITMPPWPGDGEAMFVAGIWNSSLISGLTSKCCKTTLCAWSLAFILIHCFKFFV